MKYGDNLVLASHSKNSTDFTSHETPNEIERNDKNESDWKASRQLKGLTDAIARFPLTTLFLLAAAIINAYIIRRSTSLM